jgi:hypothetical protein
MVYFNLRGGIVVEDCRLLDVWNESRDEMEWADTYTSQSS